MNYLLRMEGLACMVLSLALYSKLGFSWGQFFIGFLLPDVALLVYVLSQNKRLAAMCYNATHSSIGAAMVGLIGLLLGQILYQKIALIWFAHIGFDRALGYGLKYGTGFKDTHLGVIKGGSLSSHD